MTVHQPLFSEMPEKTSERAMLESFVTPSHFVRLRSAYEEKWGAALAVLDDEGRLVMGSLPPISDSVDGRRLLAMQMREAMRWGEAPFDLLADGAMVWVVPVVLNMRLLGGIAAYISRERMFTDVDDMTPNVNMREAAVELRRLVEDENLTNAPLLELRRGEYFSERSRAEAIHAFKAYSPDFRTIYIREEPALMAAIRKGDREEARSTLNRILVVLHYQAGDNLALIKSFFLEVVTLMCRTAVETGCDAKELLGKNYEAFTSLSSIYTEDELGPWLHDMLERLLDAIHRHRNDSPLALLQAAMAYMHENLHRDINRDEVAAIAHLSPAHFSRIFKREMKECFSDMLNRMRIDRAAELLARTERSLCMIALDCGFKDQSYFTKVFRKYMNQTPREYRLRLQSSRKDRDL